MRYIRTKEGIIVDTTKYKNVVERTFRDKVVAIDLNHWGQDNDKYPTWIDVKDIIKQADTIEELCDEFALISELEKRIIKPKELDKDFEGWTKEIGIPEGIIKVYGAIWTDKGLIYVAKINDKGELELL